MDEKHYKKRNGIYSSFLTFMKQQSQIPVISILFGIFVSTLFALINQFFVMIMEYNYTKRTNNSDDTQSKEIRIKNLSIIHVIVQTFAILLSLGLSSYIRSYFRRRNIKFVESAFIDAIGIVVGAFIVIVCIYVIDMFKT